MGVYKSQSETRREFLKYAGIGGGTLLLAGCTGNQSPDGTSDGSQFTYTTTITPSTIDPHRVSDELESIFAHNVYDPLLYYTPETPPETKPWLAEDWEVSDDNRTFTFSLRDDATFHNGDDVTGEDVAFSVERLMTMNQGFSFMFQNVLEPDAVTVVDEKTVEISLTSQYAPFISALPFLFIANANQIRDNIQDDGEYGDMGDYGTQWLENNTAGSGPYEMTGRTRQSAIDHQKHDDWWGEFADGDTFDEFRIDMTPEVSTAAGKIREGEAHLSDQYLPLETFNELDQRDDVRVSVETTFTPMYLFMHNERAPFDDINVRRAMAYAFDYDQLINGIMAGDSVQMQGPLPQAMWGHNGDLEVYSKDLDRARELLDESQYSGSDLDFTYTYVSGLSIRENMGLMLQSDLNEIGVDVEITSEPWSRITSMHQNIDESPQMTSTVLSFSYADPDNFLYPAWHSSSHGSWQSGSWYSNDRVDELLDEARRTVAQEDRVPLYQEAQQLINEDVPAVFTMNQATRYAVREDIQGFTDNGLVGYLQTPHRFTQES